MSEQLLQAVSNGDLGQVKDLISQGVDVDYFNLSGDWSDYNAVEIAAGRGFVEILRELLKAGARNRTYVHTAISRQHPAIVREWLKHDTSRRDLDEPGDSMGETILMHAAGRGNVEIVRMLVEAGANVDMRSWGGDQTALDFAVERDHTEVIHYLWPLCSQETREEAGVPNDPRV